MLTTSKNANPNYTAKVVKINTLKPHPNADKLQIATVDFNPVIVGLDCKVGDVYVYCPPESKLSKEFLSATNSFRDKTLNKDGEKAGFFESSCRVRTVKLRGEYSCGYLIPAATIQELTGVELSNKIDITFDTLGNSLFISKHVKDRFQGSRNKIGKTPQVTRLIEGQYKLHVDTENLRRNATKISPSDIISITTKTHGTSFVVGNVLVKRKLNFVELILSKFIKIHDTEYDIVYGSRRVVKNQSYNDLKNGEGFYQEDIWKTVKDRISPNIPEGFTVYGEILGYTEGGKAIQKGYDYGCQPGAHKIEVYRVTSTNAKGMSVELSYPQMAEFCERAGLTPSELLYYGKAFEKYPEISKDTHWHVDFVKHLEKEYTEKDCPRCKNKVPEEGIVVRKENLFSCESYKLKSFRFLKMETDLADNGEENIEDNS